MKIHSYLLVSSILALTTTTLASPIAFPSPKTTLEGPNGIITEDDGSQTIGGTSQGITKSSTGQVTNIGGESGITITNTSTPVTPASALAGATAAKASAAALQNALGVGAGATAPATAAKAEIGTPATTNGTKASGKGEGAGISLGNSTSAAGILNSIFGAGGAPGGATTGAASTTSKDPGTAILGMIFGKDKREEVRELAKRGDYARTVEGIKRAAGYGYTSSTEIEVKEMAKREEYTRTIEGIKRSIGYGITATTRSENESKIKVRNIATQGNLGRTVAVLEGLTKRGVIGGPEQRIQQSQGVYAIPGSMRKREENEAVHSLRGAARRGDLASVGEMVRELQGGGRYRVRGSYRA